MGYIKPPFGKFGLTKPNFVKPPFGMKEGAFSPADLPDLVAWFDGDLGITGDPVDQQADQSGNAYHGTSAGANRPTISANAINGHDAILYDGTDDYLTVPRMTGEFAAGITWAIVFQIQDGVNAAGQSIFGAVVTVGGVQRIMNCHILAVTGILQIGVSIDGVNYQTEAHTFDDGVNAWCYASFRAVAGDHIQIYFNGLEVGGAVDISGATWANALEANTETINMGGRTLDGVDGNSDNFVEIAGLYIFGSGFSDANMNKLHGYIDKRYGF